MAKGNWLEFELDQPDIVLHGMADDSPGVVFSGRLIVHLCEPIRVKGLQMALDGHERLEWEYHNNGAISTFFRETTPLAHTWSFFATADGRKSEVWKAGCHEFPFSLAFPGNLPESIRIPYADVNYQLKATLRRTGIMHNITAKREVQVKRDLAFDGGFGAGAIDVENRWREMMEFRIASDADTFIPGDRMHAQLTFQPLVKHMRLAKVGVMLKEYVRCHKPSGHAEKTVSRVVASAEAVPVDSAADVSTGASAGPSTMSGGGQGGGQGCGALLPGPAPTGMPGIDLAGVHEESIQLKVPTERRRLQYDHISSHVEITHKLKFSIHFQDPNQKSHTLWISVPVSVVPVMAAGLFSNGLELPTYENAVLDQRVVVAGIEQSPPTYDATVADSLPRSVSSASSLATLDTAAACHDAPPTCAPRASSRASSSTSVHSNADTVSFGIVAAETGGAATCPAGRTERTAPSHVSCTRLSVDCSRSPVHPVAVRDFFCRPVVFPASAESTPLATPAVSPHFKTAGDTFQHGPAIRAPPPVTSASTRRG
ncbi:hypothetical protein LPJ61_001691 [Coemansia biformis]|uniref:Arrestin C-terminal-like domain-containing protein n=1 Tax=Coemansia biformis TaxID=1286918 RepID=A0A9W7YFY1_9FUNG|nr:hypothetical protein LPJ61_001691 [Coemansia biformis]